MNDNETSSEYKMSSYNSAGNTIKRIDVLWTSAHRAVISGDYLKWNILLDRLWLEVAGDLPLDDDKRTDMKKINAEIVKLYPLHGGQASGFNKLPKDYKKTLSQQYLKLREKEEMVKFMENKLGLGKSYVDEMEDDWD